jgi:homoserine dehydrogenase
MSAASDTPVRIVLLGTGNVGRAVLARLVEWEGHEAGRRLLLAAVANTRSVRFPEGTRVAPGACAGDPAVAAVRALGGAGTRVVVDATASEAIAARHAAWLDAGLHVVTACKLGQGAGLARWQAIRDACAGESVHYGDSATVGAGLPLLRSIRALQAGGDRIHGIAGVLSGSLAWLLDRYDGSRPFAALVEEARALGYTEPDPQVDLSGEDVRRKLLILARAAGIAIEADAVAVEPLRADALPARHAQARQRGEVLRYVARLQRGPDGIAASVGLAALPAADPLAGGGDTDNRVAIWSDRYAAQPLLIQGPGAGAGVTAAALLDDVLRIARKTRAYEIAVALRSRPARYAGSGCGWSMA